MVGTWAGRPLFAQDLLASLIRLIVVLDALFWPRRPSATLGYLTLCGLLLVLNAALEEWAYGVNGTVFYDLVYPRYLCDVLWHIGVGSCSLYFF